jgi:lipopolysaccharide/colanic/teichoic acid biosynthesis glycosyltransferase
LLKRLFDLVVSLLALLVVLPFGIIISVILKFTGEGYILYLQPRVGKDGKIFNLLKFVTMRLNSPNTGAGDITVHNDPRVFPFGRFLRKTKFNELPQLINVLKGDLSIVGPRPQTPKNFAYYTEEVKKEIIKMTPGLTGIGSIVFRDEEQIIACSSKSYIDCYKEDIVPYKGKLELWYQQNQSFVLDLKMIFLTAWVILFPQSNSYEKMLSGLPRR